jgi:hypothetical protein
MRYYGLPLRPMQESGAFLLRALQNEDMPRLDLLVRESVQNALDAALEREPGGEVRIGFHLRAHATETIASLLADGIDRKVLRERHPDGGQLLEIRDSLTEGLTGPLGFDEIGPDAGHGNLLKLVYEIGRTRSDVNAGGSWGLGKTCYFQMGIGLVFYYSRIKLGDVYQERLVASLVEDETRPDRLQRDTRTGIGWWGAEEGLKPVTRTAQIQRTLDMLRVERFTGAETGTSIIIPFLRDDLVPTVASDDGDSSVHRPWWYDNYNDYIRIALERWFCARLDNRHFATGPHLTAAVNGKVIASSSMLPIFQAVQALYNRANGVSVGDGDYLTRNNVPASAIMQQPVAPRSLFTLAGPAGDVAAALLTPEQLGMAAPVNHYDPGMCVFGRSGATPPYRPLVTFMRQPGMCVCWDDSTESRGWAGGLPGVADSRYLVAVFVPRQERILADSGRRIRDETPVTLESYLRGCERADHATWHDVAGLKVIERIRSNCARILRDFGSRRAPAVAVAPSIRMARNLADLVLPERGMGADGRSGRPSPPRPGRAGSGGGGVGGSGGGGRRPSVSAMPVLKLLEVAYTAQGLQVQWSLEWGSADPGAPRTISLGVDSESGPITLLQWHSDRLGTFPFRVLDAAIESEGENAAGVSVVIESDRNGAVLLRTCGIGPSGALRGMLRIGQATSGAGALRPVLAAGLADIATEHA